MRTSGTARAARAWKYWADADLAARDATTRALLLMFCALNGATFRPWRAYQRHSAVASQLLPAPLVVPSTITQCARINRPARLGPGHSRWRRPAGSCFGQRHPVAIERMRTRMRPENTRSTAARGHRRRWRVVGHPAVGHHQQVVGPQRQRQFVQHGDGGAAGARGALPGPARRPGAAGPGWPAARPSAAPARPPPAHAPAGRAGAPRRRVARAAARASPSARSGASPPPRSHGRPPSARTARGGRGSRPSIATSRPAGPRRLRPARCPSHASARARSRLLQSGRGAPASRRRLAPAAAGPAP